MTVGFTCGSFDLLHAGHALMLEEAKSHCDRLVVGLQIDPTLDRPEKNRPILSIDERLIMLKSVKWVDEIRMYESESDLISLLKSLKPDVRIVGSDWKGKQFTGYDLPIRVVFNTRDHSYSTSSLRDRVLNAELQKRASAALAPHMQSVIKAMSG
jgi:glycerol-3-phosphate cytidylyltransferase